MDKIVDYMSSYTSALKFEDIPSDVVHQAKRMWVDTLACALGGYTSEPSQIAREVGKSITSAEPATILFSGDRTSVEMASFANGIMLRYLDYMDFMQYAALKHMGHPSETFAAVLSPAEAAGRDGKTVLLGTVLGWEVMARLAEAANIGDFCHCTNIAIAASCAAAKMMGLSQEQTAHAIGMTANSHITLSQAHLGNVCMWKGCTAANGCKNAVFSSLLASKGMTGPLEVFEGRGGLIRGLTKDGQYELPPFGGRGGSFRIMESSIKNYPCGSVAQSAVDCALAIRPRLSNIDDIQQVNVRSFGQQRKEDGTIYNVMADSPDKWLPQNKETADHSMPYSVALAFVFGGVEARHYSDETLHDPRLVELMQKVKVEVAEECQRVYPEQRLNIVEVVTRSGQRFEERSGYHKGHPKNPLTDKDLEKKFRSMAEGLLSRKKTDKILETLWNLDQAEDIGKVIRLMQV